MYITFYFLQSEDPQRFQICLNELHLLVNYVSIVVVGCTELRDSDLPLLSVLSQNLL